MRGYIKDIREKTRGMRAREKAEYVRMYYWYHILGIAAVIALLVFGITHFAFGTERPQFTFVMVNQPIDNERDKLLGEELAGKLSLENDRVVVDSDFHISYGDIRLEGANESSYEKFFFKWSNGELDAVLMPKSFLSYCQEMGGSFRDVKEFGEGETLVLVFPDTGNHPETCQKFMELIDAGAVKKI